MILDTINNSTLYESCHPAFKKAFDFLRQTNLNELGDNRIDLNGNDLFVLPQTYITKSAADGKLEAHQKYIDIQYVVEGTEYIGYAPLRDHPPTLAYNAANDIAFYDAEFSMLRLDKGMFAIFFPQDLHLPGRFLKQPERVKKIVIKIKAFL